MKFAIAALLGLVSSVRITQRSVEPEMTGEGIVAHCDQDGDALLSKEEAW